MTTLAQSYGTSTALTLNSTTWAQATTNSSNAIDISSLSPIADDIWVTLLVTFPNLTIGAQSAVNIYVSCSEDGTHYDDNDQYSGTNNHNTSLRSPTNFKVGPSMHAVINVTTAITFSLLQVCGGTLPRKFGVILVNQCNEKIATFSASYTAINFTNA